jgi:hypothetical protein
MHPTLVYSPASQDLDWKASSERCGSVLVVGETSFRKRYLEQLGALSSAVAVEGLILDRVRLGTPNSPQFDLILSRYASTGCSMPTLAMDVNRVAEFRWNKAGCQSWRLPL